MSPLADNDGRRLLFIRNKRLMTDVLVLVSIIFIQLSVCVLVINVLNLVDCVGDPAILCIVTVVSCRKP